MAFRLWVLLFCILYIGPKALKLNNTQYKIEGGDWEGLRNI